MTKYLKSAIILAILNLFFISCTSEADDSQQGVITVTSKDATNITNRTATIGGILTLSQDTFISRQGVAYSSSPNVDDDDIFIFDTTEMNDFTIQLENLLPDSQYFYRAFVTSNNQVFYGEEKSFTTTNVAPSVPCTVQTNRLDGTSPTLTINYNTLYADSRAFFTWGNFGLNGGARDSELRISFDVPPQNGIYKTAASGDPLGSTLCYIDGRFFFNRVYRAILDQNVYVEKLGEGRYSITLCDFQLETFDQALPTLTVNANLEN